MNTNIIIAILAVAALAVIIYVVRKKNKEAGYEGTVIDKKVKGSNSKGEDVEKVVDVKELKNADDISYIIVVKTETKKLKVKVGFDAYKAATKGDKVLKLPYSDYPILISQLNGKEIPLS